MPALIICLTTKSQRIANYVTNGSFEQSYGCAGSFPLEKAKGWLSIDSNSYAGTYRNICNSTVPTNANTYQWPKSGNAYALTNFYYTAGWIGYPKNRLKARLTQGKIYCVKFYVNICNTSTYGIDGFSAYFGDDNIDTISNCNVPLTFINPQINNPVNNIIVDTLNWIAITGTFVATGNEKYMLLGNFRDTSTLNKAPLNPTHLPLVFTDLCIDDVSCIEVGIDAYAGRDTVITPGDSVFIGREPDFAIDSGCVWYKLPSGIPIDTISGMWVKPTATSTYVVRQNIECGSIKWDTVVVHLNPVGIDSRSRIQDPRIEIHPVPAGDYFEVSIRDEFLVNEFKTFKIFNSLGQAIREDEIYFGSGKALIQTNDLANGVYVFLLQSDSLWTVSRRFVIER